MTAAPVGLDGWAAAGGYTRALDAADPVMVEVPSEEWLPAIVSARDALGLAWFDALTVVDEGDGTFSVIVHLVKPGTPVSSLLVRTRLASASSGLASLSTVFAGAQWHEREAAEMFGVRIVGGHDDRRLLLPDGFDGAPMRKDFVMATRAARTWPGAKDPGESDADVSGLVAGPPAEPASEPAPEPAAAPKRRRRRAVPPGVMTRDDQGRW